MNLNKAMIIGNLTHDPETKKTPSGLPVTTFSVATNFIWTDQSGQRQEKVEFHNVVAWRRLAEVCAQYLHKGSRAYIEGRLQTRNWIGQDNVKRYRTEIVAENMIMLDKPQAGGAVSALPDEPPTPAEPIEAKADDGSGATEEEIKVENVPF